MEILKAGYNGILLPAYDIAFDFSTPRAQHIFVSHAHSDHMPRSSDTPVYCTPNTFRLMQKRGYRDEARVLDFGQTVSLPAAEVTLFPAGHILGSAMVYVQTDEGSVLYTGDYRTPPSPATEGFECPEQVDYLITEATFSLPVYRWAPYDELIAEVRQFAIRSLKEGNTPVFLAYNLGKAQEVMHMLAPTGLPVQIHGAGYKLCEVYEEAGIELGNYGPYHRDTCEGKVLVTTNSAINNGFASNVKDKRLAYCSGWAARESSRTQLTVDRLIPLSDHLDFFELIALCQRLHPRRVDITHTPNAGVVQHYLDELGIRSRFLDLESETDD